MKATVYSAWVFLIKAPPQKQTRATLKLFIKTHGSESRGQEEAACTRVFWPTRPLQ